MKQLETPNPPLEETPEDIEEYIFALHSAIHSLESISIDFPTLRCKNPLKLRDFEAVTALEIRDYQLFGTSGLSSVAFPPNLESLTFLNEIGGDEALTELLCYTLEKKDIFAKNLRRLVVPEGTKPLPQNLVDVCTDPLVLCTTAADSDSDSDYDKDVDEEDDDD